MNANLLRRSILAALGSAAGLVVFHAQGCNGSTEETKTYTDGGNPISVPSGNCRSGSQDEVECYAPSSLPRINQGNIPRDPDAAPPPPGAPPPRDANGCVPPSFVQDGCCNAAVTGPVFDGVACCYRFCTGSCCGRPLVLDGVARVADAIARDDWGRDDARAHAPAHAELDAITRAEVALAWQSDAQMEHASIASFARFTLDLLALGAPPELVEASQRASLDEIGHARSCFGIASRVAGRSIGPGPIDLRGAAVTSASLSEAAAAAVRDGCIGETIAAMIASEQLRVASDLAVRAALETIAQDEARHAELAWSFVAWAVRAGGDDVRVAVERAFSAGLATIPVPPGAPAGVSLEAWRSFGRLTTEEARVIAAQAAHEVIAPCAKALTLVS